MIELSNIIILIDWITIYSGSVHCSNINSTSIKNSNPNNILDRKFIYKSIIPTLVLAVVDPIEILVYVPMYITKPTTVPVLNTVLAHIVFYNVSFYFIYLNINKPENWYISLFGALNYSLKEILYLNLKIIVQ